MVGWAYDTFNWIGPCSNDKQTMDRLGWGGVVGGGGGGGGGWGGCCIQAVVNLQTIQLNDYLTMSENMATDVKVYLKEATKAFSVFTAIE